MLHGKTHLLRAADVGDLDLLRSWTSDPAWYEGFESDHWTWRPSDLAEQLRRTPEYEESGWFLVIPAAVGGPVGWIAYRQFFAMPALRAVDFGYRIGPAHRGHGHATAAARLLVNQLFSRLSVHRVQAHAPSDNAASQRVLSKAGLTREGVLRGVVFGQGEHHDVVMYSILRPEWCSADDYGRRYGPL